jgi:hypothetical protein
VLSYKYAAHIRRQPGQRIGKIENKTPVREKRSIKYNVAFSQLPDPLP